MALTSGWASALAVATANFLGVRSEHVHIQVLPEGKSRMSLLELNGKKRLASQADNMLRAAGAPDKLSSQPLGSVVLFIAVAGVLRRPLPWKTNYCFLVQLA